MERNFFRRMLRVALLLLGAYFAVRFVLPVSLPFLLGLAVARMAEPAVVFLEGRLRLPRPVGAAIAVSGAFVMLFALLWLVLALAYRELSNLAAMLPGFFSGLGGAVDQVRTAALELAQRAPGPFGIRLAGVVTDLFEGGDLLLDKAADRALGLVSGMMGWIPGSALLVGTAVISSYMFSAKLPALKIWLYRRIPGQWQTRFRENLRNLRANVGCWLKAQLKLSGLTLGIVAAGLALLRVRGWWLWAPVIALVDAVPILGTGTVLIPWCILRFLRGDSIRAIGLLGIYVTAVMTRSAMEPRLVGRQLGIDPLVTLAALYAGYCFWGIGGMLLAPILAVTLKQFAFPGE